MFIKVEPHYLKIHLIKLLLLCWLDKNPIITLAYNRNEIDMLNKYGQPFKN